MACPTCDHTMQKIGSQSDAPGGSSGMVYAGKSVYWCPRCGTVKDGEGITQQAPMLVYRVRQLLDQTTNDDLAWSLSVTESIWKPGDERRQSDMTSK